MITVDGGIKDNTKDSSDRINEWFVYEKAVSRFAALDKTLTCLSDQSLPKETECTRAGYLARVCN